MRRSATRRLWSAVIKLGGDEGTCTRPLLHLTLSDMADILIHVDAREYDPKEQNARQAEPGPGGSLIQRAVIRRRLGVDGGKVCFLARASVSKKPRAAMRPKNTELRSSPYFPCTFPLPRGDIAEAPQLVGLGMVLVVHGRWYDSHEAEASRRVLIRRLVSRSV